MSVDDLPLRPMTSAEVLDAAIGVMRRRPWRLLGLALALAVAEQATLYPVRLVALSPKRGYFPPSAYWHAFNAHLASLWELLAIGAGTEAAVIALLGGVAGRSAVSVLLAGLPDVERDDVLPRVRYLQLVLVAAIVGVGATVTFFLGGAPWAFWFMFTGLAAPALIIDGGAARMRPGVAPRGAPPHAAPIGAFRAVGRAMLIVGRASLRPGGLRLLGYLMWFVLRMIVGVLGVIALTSLFGLSSPVWTAVVGYLIWAAINAVAYASMASLDATAHLEARMRLEGLDIALGRAAHTHTPVASLLAAPR